MEATTDERSTMTTTRMTTLTTEPEDLPVIRTCVQRNLGAEVVAVRPVSASEQERHYCVLWVQPARRWGTHAVLVGIEGTACSGLSTSVWGHYFEHDEAAARRDWSER